MKDDEIKQIRARHEQEILKFIDDCPHTEISDWMPSMWAPGHYGPNVKICLRCHKQMDPV